MADGVLYTQLVVSAVDHVVSPIDAKRFRKFGLRVSNAQIIGDLTYQLLKLHSHLSSPLS